MMNDISLRPTKPFPQDISEIIAKIEKLDSIRRNLLNWKNLFYGPEDNQAEISAIPQPIIEAFQEAKPQEAGKVITPKALLEMTGLDEPESKKEDQNWLASLQTSLKPDPKVKTKDRKRTRKIVLEKSLLASLKRRPEERITSLSYTWLKKPIPEACDNPDAKIVSVDRLFAGPFTPNKIKDELRKLSIPGLSDILFILERALRKPKYMNNERVKNLKALTESEFQKKRLKEWQQHTERLITDICTSLGRCRSYFILFNFDGLAELEPKFFNTFYFNNNPAPDPTLKKIITTLQDFKGVWEAKIEVERQTPKGGSEAQGDTPMTLIEFMSERCEKLSDNILERRVKSLQSLHRREKIKLKHIGSYKQGQSKKYKPSYLTTNWPQYQLKLPTLPNLRQS
jgi:hypothetical protein